MATFLLKLKTKHGQKVLKTVGPNSTLGELKCEISKLTSIPIHDIVALAGFPPKSVDFTIEHICLRESNIKSGDTLIIEARMENVEEDKNSKSDRSFRPHTSESVLGSPGILLKKVVPADNSCLFTSLGFVLSGKVDLTCGTHMRKIIAATVANEPDNYNEAILGRPNQEYCEWIQKPDSWGGAIELAVLTKFYGIEIAVIDTINAIINRFGEDQDYNHRVFLIFDGIHYDPLYLEPFEEEAPIQTMFPTSDEKIMREAEILALEAKTSRQFTDVNKFTLQCLECSIYLTGQKEALDDEMTLSPWREKERICRSDTWLHSSPNYYAVNNN